MPSAAADSVPVLSFTRQKRAGQSHDTVEAAVHLGVGLYAAIFP